MCIRDSASPQGCPTAQESPQGAAPPRSRATGGGTNRPGASRALRSGRRSAAARGPAAHGGST
eukprot:6080388-Alexandrium_andersonii.AAC.1